MQIVPCWFDETYFVHQRVEHRMLVEIRRRSDGIIPQTGVCQEARRGAMRGRRAPQRSRSGSERNAQQGCARDNIARRRAGLRMTDTDQV